MRLELVFSLGNDHATRVAGYWLRSSKPCISPLSNVGVCGLNLDSILESSHLLIRYTSEHNRPTRVLALPLPDKVARAILEPRGITDATQAVFRGRHGGRVKLSQLDGVALR